MEGEKIVRQIETAVCYDERKIAFFSSDERKWITKIRKLAESRPDECQITVQPEGNDGCINAKFPASWVKIGPPKRMNLTEEQRKAMSERMRRALDNTDDLPFDENNEDYEYEDEEDDE